MKSPTEIVDMVDMGFRLKEVRRQRGLNQSQLAELLGVKQSTVSDYEQGKLALSIDQACLLNQQLGVDFNWLFYGK